MTAYKILKEYNETLMNIEDILGSGVTNNMQLTKLCNNIFGDSYIGTFTSDSFPKYVRNGQKFIINNKSSKTNGQHWISAYKYNKKFYMYDSFNRNIKSLSQYFKNKRIVNANNDRDQSYKEYSCGARCVSWLICFERYKDKIINII